ncbi:hypothetical protein [Chryseobacterium indoltheticum]|uniref:hypothetical protein n=1 Tax=Chryseobacterium indoltheticum TaxID=254 RepID=UPI003F4922DF
MYAISPTTDWSFFAFDVRDPASINAVYDHYDIGVAPCAGTYPTNGIGTVSETSGLRLHQAEQYLAI